MSVMVWKNNITDITDDAHFDRLLVLSGLDYPG
jgi:hypothetical protein